MKELEQTPSEVAEGENVRPTHPAPLETEEERSENEALQKEPESESDKDGSTNPTEVTAQVNTLDEHPSDGKNQKSKNTDDNQLNVHESPQDNNGVPKKTSAKKTILIAASAIIGLVILGFLVSPKSEPLDASATVSCLSFNYPSTWEEEQIDGGIKYVNYKESGLEAVRAYSTPSSSRAQFSDDEDKGEAMRIDLGLEDEESYFEDDYTHSDLTINGYPATEYEYSAVRDDDVPVRVHGIAILSGPKMHVIQTQADASMHSDQKTMDSILETVTLDVPEHKVTYRDEAGNEVGDGRAYDYGDGATIMLPLYSRNGDYLLSNWSCKNKSVVIEQSDGNTTASNITKDIELVAKTTKCWHVTFTNGDGDTISEVYVETGKSAPAPEEPQKTGFAFNGWDADFSNVTNDMTVNATWRELPKTYSAGSYRVGTDIPAGEYKMTCTGSHAYYCVYPDAAKADILSNGNFTTCSYIKVSDGQLLEVKGATFLDAAGAIPTTTVTGDGIYKIGFDLNPGQYNVVAQTGDMGYYSILSTVDATVSHNIVDNDNFEGNSFISVSNGQYLELSRSAISS